MTRINRLRAPFYGLLPFIFLFIWPATIQAQNEELYNAAYTNPMVQRIMQLDNTVRKANMFTGFLTAQDLTRLPIGIMDPSGKVVICIDSARFTPNGASFNAYAAVQLPGMKEKMCFRAANIPFGPNGITSADAPALTLVSTHVLQLGDQVDLVLPGNGGNNIRWDCGGFKEVNLEGKFVFKQGFFIPDNQETSEPTVTATVKFEHISNINNLMASVSMTPFKIRGLEDLAFKITDATVDLSDHANPASFQFPAVYQNEYGDNINLWRGFFLRNITVRLPFNKSNGQASFTAANMLIDENGVSGLFAVNNLFGSSDGSMNGWNFSLDSLQIELLRNKLTGGLLAGTFKVPFLGENGFGYKAAMSQWNDDIQYLFQVRVEDSVEFDLPLGVTAKLKQGSYIQVEKYQGKLEPSAVLHGSIGATDDLVKFSGVKFQDLTLSTQAPYIHRGIFSIEDTLSTPSLAGFKVSISNLGISLNNGQARLSANVALGFMESADRGFGASGGFVFKAHMQNETTPVQRQRWVSDGLTINEIALSAHMGSFDLEGNIAVYKDDPKYGKGFKGNLLIRLDAVGSGITLAAQAYFGNKDNYKYFQISGLATPGTGIMIAPQLYLDGLLGGLSYHMTRPPALRSPYLVGGNGGLVGDPDTWARQVYEPDGSVGFGILLGTTYYVEERTLMSGGVALEVELNNNWGLNYVNLKGSAILFKNINAGLPTSINDGTYAANSIFTAEMNVMFDRPNRTFHANLVTYLNIFNVIHGAGPSNRLGEMVLHISPSKWFFYVGRPSSPLGAKLTLANVDLASVQTYFMTGSQLDPFPNPPNEVLQNISYTPGVSATALQAGAGVAFGARLSSTAGFDANWIYALMSVGAGADVMLSTSGNYTCNGEAVGFDGWWARGQAYAWVQGGIGIRVKVFGKKRDFKIAQLAAALLLQAKIPKPSWFRGHGYISWNLLGGLVKGRAGFKVELGKECQTVSNGNTDRDIVASILAGTYPAAGQNNVEVYGVKTIICNVPVNQEFSQLDEEGVNRSYKIKVDYFRLKKNGQPVTGTVSYGENNKYVYFSHNGPLTPDAAYTVQARFVYMKQIDGGAWTAVLNENGAIAAEDTAFTFHTGPPSSNIAMGDIEYAWPFSEMKNFYKNQYAQGGYMKISNAVNLDNVFYPGTPGSGNTYEYKVKIKDVSPNAAGEYLQPFTRTGQLLRFNMPAELTNEHTYRLSLVRIATNNGSNGVNNQNLTQSQNFGADSSYSFSDTVVNNVVTGTVSLNETEMFRYHFRVSKFNTFSEKINSMTAVTENLQDMAAGNVVLIASRNNTGGELFDDFELNPLATAQNIDGEDIVVTGNPAYVASFPMLSVRADSTNTWLQNDILPLVYPATNDYFGANVTQTARGAGSGGGTTCTGIVAGTYTGVPPLQKVVLEHTATGAALPHSDAYERLSQNTGATGDSKLLLKYNLPYYINSDYTQMYLAALCQWATAAAADRTQPYTALVESGGVFPQIKTGIYKVKITYTLPGNMASETKEVNIQY